MIRDEERHGGGRPRKGRAGLDGGGTRLLYVELVLSSCARSTQQERSERRANSFKIGGEITRNWRPFKNIITSLFPQQEVQGWGGFLIRTGDGLAIKLLSQTLSIFMQGMCVPV